MSMLKRSMIWRYYSRKSKETAECLKCKKILKCAGGSTSSLTAHIQNVHHINISDDSSHEKSDFESKRQKTITDFIRKKSIEEEISKLASVDGLSFHCIAKSEFIQESLGKTIYDKVHPTSHQSVKKMVLNFYNEKKTELAYFFKSVVKLGKRFSLSLDEYTSSQCKRYININVHDVNEHWSLGMIKISHSLNYARIIDVVSKRLEEFDLDFKSHIVGCTTDGASLMVKFGKETAFSYQQCIAHCIHLAVCDVLYCKVRKNTNDKHRNDAIVDEDEFSREDEELYEEEHMDKPLFENVSERNEFPQLNEQYLEVINKVRRICRMFRNSPLKNDRLQDFVKNEFNEELKLILDCKIRWNSLVAMIERFLKLQNCISKALRVIASTENVFDEEWVMLKNLVEVLQPLEMVLKLASSEDATLLKADMLMKICLTELGNKNNPIAVIMKECLIERYLSRRNKEIVSLLKFLSNPETENKTDQSDIFSMAPQQVILRFAEKTILRLFKNEIKGAEIEEDSKESLTVIHDIQDQPSDDDLLSQYRKELEKLKLPKRASYIFNINSEFKHFIATHEKTNNLKLLFNALLTMKPTSVEAERSFSVAGFFLSKLRARMGEDTLNALCFLRCYFKKKQL